MAFQDEGRWDIHFFPCGGGCHHLTQVDITDSRAGFQKHVDHMVGCSGIQGWDDRPKKTRDEIAQVARSLTPMTEYEIRHRFERKCDAFHEFNTSWHGPHTWFHPHNTGTPLECYGFGSPRRVPEIPQHYYTPEIQNEEGH